MYRGIFKNIPYIIWLFYRHQFPFIQRYLLNQLRQWVTNDVWSGGGYFALSIRDREQQSAEPGAVDYQVTIKPQWPLTVCSTIHSLINVIETQNIRSSHCRFDLIGLRQNQLLLFFFFRFCFVNLHDFYVRQRVIPPLVYIYIYVVEQALMGFQL